MVNKTRLVIHIIITIFICLCLIVLLSKIYQILCVTNLVTQEFQPIQFKYYPQSAPIEEIHWPETQIKPDSLKIVHPSTYYI